MTLYIDKKDQFSSRYNNYEHISTKHSSKTYEANIDRIERRNSSTIIVGDFNIIFINGYNT